MGDTLHHRDHAGLTGLGTADGIIPGGSGARIVARLTHGGDYLIPLF
jgi:hypothetical protein